MKNTRSNFKRWIVIPIFLLGIGVFYNNNFINKTQTNNVNKEEKYIKGPPPKNLFNSYTQKEMLQIKKEHRRNIELFRANKSKTSRTNKNNVMTQDTIPQWEFRGPNTRGRVTAIVADKENPNKVYVGTPAGGVWKSTDGGAHYRPIFDDAGSLNIGALALDPHDSDIIYVGTGAYWSSLSTDGIWKSTNGGKTWKSLGLENVTMINSIIINPNNSNELFVGGTIGASEVFGVYKSTNGGETWKKVFSGYVMDIQMDQNHPNRLYLVTKNEVWKSEDHGNHWENITNAIGDTGGHIYRLAIAPSSTNRLYLAAHHRKSSKSYYIYRSDDYGVTWEKVPGNGATNVNSIFYCYEMVVSPIDKDKIYLAGVYWHVSDNGGETFTKTDFSTHMDKQALWISPNGETIYEGNDGGITKSSDSGVSFHQQEIPIAQFYAIEIDPVNKKKILGGTQDNGSIYGISKNNWKKFLGGDGFTVLVDNTDTRYVYAEYQNGYAVLLKNHKWLKAIGIPESKPWHMRMLLDPSDNRVAYYCPNKHLYRTTRTGDNVSTPEQVSTINFGKITSIDIAKSSHGNTIYLGATGGIWVSQDRGVSWNKTNPKGALYTNTQVTVDPHNDAIAYASFQTAGKYGRPMYRTTDYGHTWTEISGNLPHGTVYDVIVDPTYSSTLYVSTDFGVYRSKNTGQTWEPIVQNLPQILVTDLKIIKDDNKIILFAGTYGRGVYSLHLRTEAPCLTRDELKTKIANDEDVTQVNTSCIKDMSNLFYLNENFNQDISSWDVSSVTNMYNMFFNARKFNQDISDWDVSHVTNMGGMFEYARNFNQDIGDWNVSNVTHMGGMFNNALSFNQDIHDWDVSYVTKMNYMFYLAKKFNQNIKNWNVKNVINHTNFAKKSALQDSYNPFINNSSETIYEDAEDKQTTGWRVYDSSPSGATITNVYDSSKKSRVIKLSGSGTSNGFVLGGYYKNSTSWKNSTKKSIKWSMKTDKAYYVFVSLDTKKGHRYVYYTNASNNNGKNGKYIHHGLGSTSSNGNWHNFTRNLEADLKEYESDNSIIAVEGFLVRGNVRLDDIALLLGYK